MFDKQLNILFLIINRVFIFYKQLNNVFLEFAKLSETEEDTGGRCTHLIYMTSFEPHGESGNILKINCSIDAQK